MATTNNVIFNKIWNNAQKYGLNFISSNGGTGKTVYFKFRLLRDAVEREIPFHIFVRYANQMKIMANAFLLPKDTFSKRQIDLLNKCEVLAVDEKNIFIVEIETQRKLAQIVNLHGQAQYKPLGAQLRAKRAFFDEVLAEQGDYCPEELAKFSRLIFTMARGDKYNVFCTYNNTNPDFPYFKYYGGKSYDTHISKSGALFTYFVAKQYSLNEEINDPKSIQSIIRNTAYGSIYDMNTFSQFENYYKDENLYGATTHFKIEIENRIFKVRELDGVVYLDAHLARKKNKKKIFSINETHGTKYKQLPDVARYGLEFFKENAKLKTARINDTIFVKILCDNL